MVGAIDSVALIRRIRTIHEHGVNIISSRDIYSAANLLIKQYGSETLAFAHRSSYHLALRGDRAGAAIRLRVSRAVKTLQQSEPTAAQ